jgi:putative ABC transport system substrate-binding protein
MMASRLVLMVILTLALLAAPLAVEAQQAGKVPRIGYLTQRSGAGPREEAFRQGLRDLGYVPGKDIVIEERYSVGGLDGLNALAAELVRLKVEIIVTGGPTATRSAKEATTTIPIVMAQDSDPVGNGFVASLARPGRNITGLSGLYTELNGKRLELLKEVVPRLSRVAVLGTSSEPGNARALRETELAAKALAVQLQYLDVRELKDIEAAFRAASLGRADAVLTLFSPVVLPHQAQFAALAIKSRLPVMHHQTEAVRTGVLISFGVSMTDLFRRAATYVDKILKGAKPADLPVEQPTKFELVINLKAAKAIGLTIPPSVLARADEVIE